MSALGGLSSTDYAALMRAGVVTALQWGVANAVLPDCNIETPGDWNTQATSLAVKPTIQVRQGDQDWTGLLKEVPTFEIHVAVEIQLQQIGVDPVLLQTSMETNAAGIWQSIMTEPSLMSYCERVSKVKARLDITSQSEEHTGTLSIMIYFQMLGLFPPRPGVPLTGVQVIFTDQTSGEQVAEIEIPNLQG